jgi:hypothetical protein
MLYMLPDTPSQQIYLTLYEGRSYFTTAFTNYLMILTYEMSGQSFAQVVDILSENERITKLQVTTEDIVKSGRYHLEVYGQNSTTNLDPADASVVGLVERGLAFISTDAVYYDVSSPSIPTDIVYTGI